MKKFKIFVWRSRKAPKDSSFYVKPEQFGRDQFIGIKPRGYIRVTKVVRQDDSFYVGQSKYVKVLAHPQPEYLPHGSNIIHCGPIWINLHRELESTRCSLRIEFECPSSITQYFLKAESLFLSRRFYLKLLIGTILAFINYYKNPLIPEIPGTSFPFVRISSSIFLVLLPLGLFDRIFKPKNENT